MYIYLKSENLLLEEQKGLRCQSCGTKDHFLIDKTIFRDCMKRHSNLAIAYIDYKKAYNFAPNSWISECMKNFGIAENVRNFMQKSMGHWKLCLHLMEKNLPV